jgi:Uma2 family endonuclease
VNQRIVLGAAPQPAGGGRFIDLLVAYLLTTTIIEVAHTTADYDREVKIPIYARHGIAEVWLFEVEAQRLSIYLEPGARGYQQLLNPAKHESVSPSLLAGVKINLADLW